VRALVVIVALTSAAAATAQEPCDPCVVLEAPPQDPSHDLWFTVSAGPTYRRAFREDFAAAALELEVGGQTSTFSVAARFSTAFGASRVGLPYEFLTLGPAFGFRLSTRVRLVVASTFGVMVINRASASRSGDPNIWGLTAGLNGTVTVDLVRSRRDGALFLAGRVGWDYIGDSSIDTGSSLAATAALGYRY
jgi:hypothetical protein